MLLEKPYLKHVTGVLMDFDDRNRPENAGMKYRTLIITVKNGIETWRWHLVDQGVPPEQIYVIDPADRSGFEKVLSEKYIPYAYVIMHWDALIRVPNMIKNKGHGIHVWNHVIADEVHYAKNREAKRTVVFKRIKALKKTGLSGTPADDKPQDFWSIGNWLYPDDPQFSSV